MSWASATGRSTRCPGAPGRQEFVGHRGGRGDPLYDIRKILLTWRPDLGVTLGSSRPTRQGVSTLAEASFEHDPQRVGVSSLDTQLGATNQVQLKADPTADAHERYEFDVLDLRPGNPHWTNPSAV